jgi:hypothetical protein
MELKRCPYCGEQILAIAKVCKHCGRSLDPQVENQSQQSTNEQIPPPIAGKYNYGQQNDSRQQMQQLPKTWLVESILVTLFCCLPFGIAGIVNASKVESSFYAGNLAEANRRSAEAKKWTTIAFWLGIVGTIAYIIAIAAGVVEGFDY